MSSRSTSSYTTPASKGNNYTSRSSSTTSSRSYSSSTSSSSLYANPAASSRNFRYGSKPGSGTVIHNGGGQSNDPNTSTSAGNSGYYQ